MSLGNNGPSRGVTLGNGDTYRGGVNSVMADFHDAITGLKRGNDYGQRTYGLKTLVRIAEKLGEEKLLEAIGALSEEVLMDREASLLFRINAIQRVAEFYQLVERMRKAKAERDGEGEVVIGSAKKEGAAQAGLPAFNADAVRAAMKERGKGGMDPTNNEEKMAVALITLAHADPKDENEHVISAAEDVIYELNSPVLDAMMGEFQISNEGLISPHIKSA